jgi:hypothetical protein
MFERGRRILLFAVLISLIALSGSASGNRRGDLAYSQIREPNGR